jgi:ATP-dependent exoDNAse (exonuclease V) beta subunit
VLFRSEVIKLNLNYRSTDSIVKASNEVIKKNRFQVGKKITAVKKGGAKIEVNYAETNNEPKSFIWKKIQQHLDEGIQPEEILVLYRRSAMKEKIQENLIKSGVNVQFKTIHGAKGLEAQVVFILGLNSAPGGFPDPWMQDKIYHIIKKTEYSTLLEEERRLFYVALTRAKKNVYLMSQKGNVSEFIKEIPKDLMLINEHEITGVEFEFAICNHCESKIEDHFKFCPECGKSINDNKTQVVLKTELFDSIKEKVNSFSLKHTDLLEIQILEARKYHRRAYEPWSDDENKILSNYANQFTRLELSQLFGRSLGGIKSRLKELNVNSI